MSVKATYATPLIHVAEIERSIVFYQLLGFNVVDTDGCNPLGWARLHCEGGAIMFLRAEHALQVSSNPFHLYMYTAELVAFRDQLLQNGISVSPISFHPYMPRGEFRMHDPDGNIVYAGQWGKEEQEAWEQRLREGK